MVIWFKDHSISVLTRLHLLFLLLCPAQLIPRGKFVTPQFQREESHYRYQLMGLNRKNAEVRVYETDPLSQ